MIFRTKKATEDATHAAAVAMDNRSAALIARLTASRETIGNDDSKALGDGILRMAGNLLSYTNDWLTDAAAAYREGRNPDYTLEHAEKALELIDGLLGKSTATALASLGRDIREVHLNAAAIEGGEENLRLHRELVDTATSQVAEAFKSWKDGYSTFFQPHIDRATTAMNRAREALRPDSAGVKLVSRLDALKARLRLVSSRAA